MVKETRRVSLRLDIDAADWLDQLAPSENKRGAYVSELIARAAQEAGIAPPVEPVNELAAVRSEAAALRARLDVLDRRIVALAGGGGDTED